MQNRRSLLLPFARSDGLLGLTAQAVRDSPRRERVRQPGSILTGWRLSQKVQPPRSPPSERTDAPLAGFSAIGYNSGSFSKKGTTTRNSPHRQEWHGACFSWSEPGRRRSSSLRGHQAKFEASSCRRPNDPTLTLKGEVIQCCSHWRTWHGTFTTMPIG